MNQRNIRFIREDYLLSQVQLNNMLLLMLMLLARKGFGLNKKHLSNTATHSPTPLSFLSDL